MEAGNIEVTSDGRIARAVATVTVGKRTHTLHAIGVGDTMAANPSGIPAAYDALRTLTTMIDGYLAALNQYGKPMNVYLAMLATKGKAEQMKLDVNWRE